MSNSGYESLGYILADNGFDVWFGNNRGNRYGRNHTSLDPDDGTDAFWLFSWDEMGLIDVPTFLHYVLDTTGYANVSWVGHSEGIIYSIDSLFDVILGTTQMFAAATSTQNGDEFLSSAIKKINIFIALAPAAYVSNEKSKLMRALAESDLIYKLLDRGIYEFLPYGPINQIAPEICQMVDKACDLFLMTICGPSLQINTSRIQVYVSNTPAGTSMQNMMHWLQGVINPTFQHYDYGSEALNMDKYGVAVPPMYELKDLNVRVALFAGSHDYLADPLDVQKILDESPTDKIVYYDNQPDYAHLDFVWATNANVRIYNQVVNLLKEYSIVVGK